MITELEFQTRRKNLAQQLPADSVAIIPAAKEIIRNGDAHFRFRQDSSFYYLTGFEEPDAVLVLISDKDKDSQGILFNRPRNPGEEQWTGRRLGQQGAVDVLGMQQSFPISNLSDELPKLLAGKSTVYYSFGHNPEMENLLTQALNTIKSQIRRGLKAPDALYDLEPVLSEMRLFKSTAEINLMRRAAEISAEAHKRAMRRCSQLDYEYQLEAELVYEFTRQGCRDVAYDPIVAGGENACVLHYTANNKPLNQGDLVLIDAGGEYFGYAADITRTFPVNGRYSSEQKSLYDLVLKAQRAGIATIKPGTAWNSVQQIIIQILTSGLCELGILQGSVEQLIANEAYKPFYMHNSGHWLGLDVHDCGPYKTKQNQWRPLETGMVLTVEPGLYIGSDMTHVDKRWRGIGIRIEDDILVTETGYEILSGALPVTTDEIEALMRG